MPLAAQAHTLPSRRLPGRGLDAPPRGSCALPPAAGSLPPGQSGPFRLVQVGCDCYHPTKSSITLALPLPSLSAPQRLPPEAGREEPKPTVPLFWGSQELGKTCDP